MDRLDLEFKREDQGHISFKAGYYVGFAWSEDAAREVLDQWLRGEFNALIPAPLSQALKNGAGDNIKAPGTEAG